LPTLVVGAGLIGAAFGPFAAARGEATVFADAAPLADFVRHKAAGARFVRLDVRDLDGLVATIREHQVDTIVHTAGLIGKKVQESLQLVHDRVTLSFYPRRAIEHLTGKAVRIDEKIQLGVQRRAVQMSAH
jgi:UDP-glucose 4-epimerase